MELPYATVKASSVEFFKRATFNATNLAGAVISKSSCTGMVHIKTDSGEVWDIEGLKQFVEFLTALAEQLGEEETK